MGRKIKSLCLAPAYPGSSRCKACAAIRLAKHRGKPPTPAATDIPTSVTETPAPATETPTTPISVAPPATDSLPPMVRGRCRFHPPCPAVRVRLRADGLYACDEHARTFGL